MPTNLLRKANTPKKPGAAKSPTADGAVRQVLIRVGAVVIRANLLNTLTADRIWMTLPFYGTAETWGALVHFETRAETGREPGAVRRVKPGQIAFWAEEDRVMIGYGATPLSKPGEIFLPAPCNVWARAIDDVAQLASIVPGQRVAMLKSDS